MPVHCRSIRSLQRCFLIDDVLLRSRDNRDQVSKLSEIAPKFHVFGPPNFGPNFINLGHIRICAKVWR